MAALESADACVPALAPATRPRRSIKKLLQQVEKGTQVRRSGLDRVLAELTQHRDATHDPGLRSALDRLCSALTRFLQDPNAAQARKVLAAVDAVKRVLTAAERPATKRRFWE
jgi:Ca-activated chloride channel family protein